MPQRTPLYDAHVVAGARMVDFGGWEMPINYGSQIEEHHAGLVPAQGVDGLFAIAGDHDLVTVKGPAQLALQALVVFDD